MICPNFAVTLFTDGCPVAPWGPMVEMERTHEAVRTWENDVIALHTIGYGYYYDQQFLRDLSNHTAFGQSVHSNQINEYFDIFSRNYEITSDLVLENVEVHTAEDTGIVYLTSKSATGVTGIVRRISASLSMVTSSLLLVCLKYLLVLSLRSLMRLPTLSTTMAIVRKPSVSLLSSSMIDISWIRLGMLSLTMR